MRYISPASKTVFSILSNLKKWDSGSRWFKYCVHVPVEGGILLFHVLTRELLLLTREEYNAFSQSKYLLEHWFVVPDSTKDYEYVNLVKLFLSSQRKKLTEITGYTIFPTTDCNARCFYCFELGRSRTPMSHETALKVVQYIKSHCGGKKVKLKWFGGEPLYNLEVIDIICDGLRNESVEFVSTMTSNGYLFDDDIVKRSLDCWNLKMVQITLDGTEKVYNKIKAFIYNEGNPYEIVLNNIERLLAASIKVYVRLNMDLYNADDLLSLVEDLSERFGGQDNITVYAHHLFKDGTPMADLHSKEEWDAREEAMCRLEGKLAQNGLASQQGISKQLGLNQCMADCGTAVTILPDGNVGLCEHYSETEFIGHIDHEGFDRSVIASWKETIPEIPECSDCFYYPECIKLKKCTNASVCYPRYRTECLRKTEQKMLNEFDKWKSNAQIEDEDFDVFS